MQFLYQNKENIKVLLIFTIFWFGLTLSTGTLTSGFKLIDDKDLFLYENKINELGLKETIYTEIKYDMEIGRFRPVYIIHRILQTAVFKTSFLSISIYTCLLAVITSQFLFLFFKAIGLSYMNAISMVFFSLVGAQSAIWWKLGVNESVGMVFLSLSLWLVAKGKLKSAPQVYWLGIITFLISTLAKESFILFIPGYVCIFLTIKYLEHGKLVYTIKKESNFIFTLIIIFSVEIFIILKYIGTDYSGVETSEAFFIQFIKNIYFFFSDKIFFYTYFLLNLFLMIFISFLFFQNREGVNKKNFIEYISISGSLLIITLPQLSLHNKLGFTERYLLPMHIGFSFMLAVISKEIFAYSRSNIFTKQFLKGAIWATIVFFFAFGTIPYAINFRNHGVNTNNILTTVINESSPSDNILIVYNSEKNVEWMFSIAIFLEENSPLGNFFALDLKNTALDLKFNNLKNENIRLIDNYSVMTDELQIPKIFKHIIIIPERNKKEIPFDRKDFPGYREKEYGIFSLLTYH